MPVNDGQDSHYWDSLAEAGLLGSVIDPKDFLGEKNRYIVACREAALREFIKGRPTKPADIALDFGCGTGNLARFLAGLGWPVIGVDISPGLLRLGGGLESSGSLQLVQYDGQRLPFPDACFSLTTTYVVLNHITRDIELLNILIELRRVLRTDGRLIAMEQTTRVPRYASDGSKLQRPMSNFVDLFQRAGFRVLRQLAFRSGHFPVIYGLRYGLVSRRLWPRLIQLERGYANLPWSRAFDYVDVAFELSPA